MRRFDLKSRQACRPLMATAALVFGLTLALGSMAAAWACVPQPLVVIQPAAFGAPGSQVTVDGYLFGGSMEIRWNAIDGPELATASGSNFSVPITVPQAAPGLYTILVVIRASDGSISVGGRASFLVPGLSTGVASRTSAAPPTIIRQPSSGHPLAVALVADVVAVALGAFGGVLWLSRRRPRDARRRKTVETVPAE